MTPDCEKVTIDGHDYTLSLHGDDLVIDGHTLTPGIYRKTRPWLYVHKIDPDAHKVDVTFDCGSKPMYPLYTGNSASIFDVYAKPYDIEVSTCAAFEGNMWLVAHFIEDDGVYFDLQHDLDPVSHETWQLVTPNIFVANNTSVDVAEISTTIHITNYDAGAKTATVTFSPLGS